MDWLRARIHPVWHVAALCYGVAVGVALALWLAPRKTWILWLIGLIFGVFALWQRRRMLLVVALVAGMCVGLARGGGVQHELTIYQSLQNKRVTLTGIVVDDPADTPTGVRLQLSEVRLGEQALPGAVWISLLRAGTLQRGDTITVSGVLREGFGSYAATMPGATLEQIKRVPHGDPALEMRDGFAASVRRAIAEPEASLGIGFLLGKKSELPAQLLEALKIAGLTHIIVASGYNLTILVRLARRLFAKVSKFLAIFVSGGLIGSFMAITGLSPSMTRAGLVTGMSLWAWYYGRKFHPVVLLGLALALTTLWRPSYAWGDVGWQLSFAAFAGVMIVAPIMTAYFFGREKVPIVGQILLETLAAQLVTAPILLGVFGQLSVISLLANLLIVPFIPLAMALTAAAGVGGFFPIASVAGWPAQQLLGAMIAITFWCADQPWAQVTLQPEWCNLALWYGAIFAATAYMKWRSGYHLREASLVA